MSARGLFVALLVLAAPSLAHAYPHFQLSSGSAQCSQCHVAPAGGGLLTEWGQAELGETLAGGGDGRFLHGAISLPGWLQLGGDVRVAALANDTGSPEGAELAVFPMQLDLAMRVVSGAWSASATVGARGRVRTAGSDDASLASYFISREHYAMWRPEAQGPYARIGRFAAPYGLRLADHTAYVRRYLGFNLLEETYATAFLSRWITRLRAASKPPRSTARRRPAAGTWPTRLGRRSTTPRPPSA